MFWNVLFSLFEQAVEESQNDPWEASLDRRIRALREFYCDEEFFDPWMLGGLEIFDGQTLQNLQSNPFCALLYTGDAPRYPSYQFNAVAELIDPENPIIDFFWLPARCFPGMRSIFTNPNIQRDISFTSLG